MSTRLLFVTLHVAMDHRRYIGCTVYWAIPFSRTGCICNVAGGRLPPLRFRWRVLPFNRTGYIRHAPGTAHRPFPTVSLTGPFFQPTWFKNARFLNRAEKRNYAPKRKNCQLSIVHCQLKNCQLSTVNCQLDPSLPYPRQIPPIMCRQAAQGDDQGEA